MREFANAVFARASKQGYQKNEETIVSATVALRQLDADETIASAYAEQQDGNVVDLTRTPGTNAIEVGDIMTMRGNRYSVKSVDKRLSMIELRTARIGRVA